MQRHSCAICEKAFHTIQELQSHLQTHQQPMDSDNSDSESVRSDVEAKPPSTDDDSSDEDDELDDEEVWGRIWREVEHERGRPDLMKENGQKIDKKKLSKAIRVLAEDYVEFGHQIENTDLYVEIAKEKSILMDKNYGEEEASRVAWKNRKYLVKEHAIEPFINNLDDDENEDEINEMQ